MLKYLYSNITFQEVPDEISLCISISNCPNHCKGCHSPELWEDKGTYLTFQELDRLINTNDGISCVCIMGGDNDYISVYAYLMYIKGKYNLRTAWYSGDTKLPDKKYYDLFDYIKIGPYIEDKGGLESPTTNQRFYKVVNGNIEDLTYKFYKNVR